MPSTRSPSTTRRGFLAGSTTLLATALSGSARGANAPSLTWSRTYAPGNGGQALVRDVVPTSEGFALVGLAGGLDAYRGWIGAVDAGGRARGHRLVGTQNTAFVAGVSASEAGAVLAAGVTNVAPNSTVDGHTDPYAVRVDAENEVRWARTYQADAPDGRADALVRSGNGYVLAGDVVTDGVARPWATKLDGNGTRGWEWSRTEEGSSGGVEAATAVEDGVVVAGSQWPADADDHGRSEDAWIAKLAAGGEVDWRKSFEGEKGGRVEALAPAGDGGVAALGRRGFASDDRGVGWLVALGSDGTRRWSRTYPQPGPQWNWHHDLVRVDGGYLLLGTREEPDSEDRGAWLTYVDDRGRAHWEYQAPAGTRGYAVHPLDDGGILLAGDRSAKNETAAWLSKVGGEPAPPKNGGIDLPGLPSWVGPLVVGTGIGALGAGLAARYWRE